MIRALKLFGFVAVGLLMLVADQMATGKAILLVLLIIARELLENWETSGHAAPRTQGALLRLGHVLSAALLYALVALAVTAALAALAWTVLPLTGARP